MVPLRPGDTTHDAEYREDPDLFLSRCEQEFGPVFNCYIQGQSVTAVSGRLVREVFMNEDFSFPDAIDEMTGIRAFVQSVIKSNGDPDNTLAHELVRDNISPNLPMFTPRIVDLLESILDKGIGRCEAKLVENPLLIIQEMVASASKSFPPFLYVFDLLVRRFTKGRKHPNHSYAVDLYVHQWPMSLWVPRSPKTVK